MEIGLIRKVDIDREMQQSYLDYAMSVIVARALPDARDGMKPVQRRILYAMYDMGLRPNSGYRKSARIVGEVLGKYHPHGDVGVYEAMARLAQDFSMRYQLVDGQGNFGSVDGDPPAAMRYTEASLMNFAMEMLSQIDRETVDFIDNFDGTLTEPKVLPAALPNLLLNGASGIAVGMATNVPPHNLEELLNAMIFMLEKWNSRDDISVSDLMGFVKGPDFPTGGIILQEDGKNDILSAYATGRGRITVRGRVHLEEMSRGRNRVIITELPYMTNKASLIARIAVLVRDGKLEGIADLRDESDRQGMRIVIELSKTANTDKVLWELYRRTPLQTTFGITILALVNGEPRLLSLKQAIRVYLEHRIEVIRKRSEYDLKKARQREHILIGLRVAINNLEDIIAIIRRSRDVDQARGRLMRRYKLSEIQASAILDMPLRRIATLERRKIEQEYKEAGKQINSLKRLLSSQKRIRQVVVDELLALKETYGDRRRTQIVNLKEGESAKALLTTAELMPAQNVWVGVMHDGRVARSLTQKLPRVSGRQAPMLVLKTNTQHSLYLVSEDGRAVSIVMDSVPESEKFYEGAVLSKISPFRDGDQISTVFSIPLKKKEFLDKYVVTVSRFGLVKKTSISDLPGPSSQPFLLAKVNPDDALIKVVLTNGNSDLCLVTARGMMIRFSEKDVRPMGLVAAGVNGIKMAKGDYIIGAERLLPKTDLFFIASNGDGWRINTKGIPSQGRYGQGIIACKSRDEIELVGTLLGKNTHTGVVHFQKAASRMIRIDEIGLCGRNTIGKAAMQVKANDSVYYLSSIWDGLAFWKEKK